MTFIHDRLEQNRALLAEAAAPRSPVSRFLFDPDQVMATLRERIVGQDEVLDQVHALLKVVKADIGDPERPLTVNLFVGSTGVGKTELVRLLAQAIHGRPDALCRIDMNTLNQEHYAASLTGAPPGYVGSKEGTTLFDAEAIAGTYSRPGIVLFDELEKASQGVLRSLLNVLDSGRLTLTAGSRTLDFRNSLIFMTSNIGAEAVRSYRQRFEGGWRRMLGLQPVNEPRMLEDALFERFEPEFLNRIDRILYFRRLGEPHVDAMLGIELDKLNRRLGRHGRSLQLTTNARRWLCSRYDPRFGAREMVRALRTQVEPALADAILRCPQARHFQADRGPQGWALDADVSEDGPAE